MISPEDKEYIMDMIRSEPLSDKQMDQIEHVFVTRKECNSTTEELNKKLGQDFADLAVIKFQLRLVLGILGAIGVAVLGLVVKQFWG